MEEKIYSPYFISSSKSTILQFQKNKIEGNKDDKLSLIDILHIFSTEKKDSVKYYF